MKINHLQMEKIQQIYLKQTKTIADNKYINKHDTMKISDKALQVRELEKRLADIPDIREEKVRQLKEAISKGEYQVDSQAIAKKIINDLGQE